MSLILMSEDRPSLWNSVGGAGIVESWSFDTSLTAGAKGHNLTLVNTPTSVVGKVGNAIQLVRASGQYAHIASGSATDFDPAGSFTIGIHAYPDSLPGEVGLFGKYLTTGNQREWLLELSSASRPNFLVSSGGTAGVAATAAAALVTGTWTCIMCWYNGTSINISINNGTAVSTAFTGGAFAGTAPLNLGTFNNGSASFLFDGRLDIPTFWNRELTALERTQYFNLGLGRQYPN